ncbi:hypothetical protein [Janibacter corallicola]|uniref:hypothetical protein n=1 Tax=Janibacter corallicola TaxID=415212 RepID=UPI00082D3447|nr:hypothetical protein [Janibacter corallicola]
MSSLPTPPARRLVKPSWRDARLVVGVLLVLLSVVLGGLAMAAADDRVGVWAARTAMTPGDTIEEEDLVRVEVQLGDETARYVGAQERLPNDAVLGRAVRAGELIPASAVIDPTDQQVRPVPVHVDPIYLDNLTKGSRVAVYAVTEEPEEGADAEPPQYEEVLEQSTVKRVPKRSRAVVGGGSPSSVTILVPEEQVQRVLSLDRKDTPIKLVLEGGSPERVD